MKLDNNLDRISLVESMMMLSEAEDDKKADQGQDSQAEGSAEETQNKKLFQKAIDQLRTKQSYTDFTKTLETILKGDKKTANAITYCQKEGLLDDNVKVEIKNVPVSVLHPTQREIGLEASIKFPLQAPEKEIPKIAGNQSVLIGKTPTPIVVLNETFVLDGHHRWSEASCVDPGCSMKAYNVVIPSLGNDSESAKKALKALQLAIAAVANQNGQALPTAGVKKDDANLLEASKDEISRKIDEILSESNGKDLPKRNADELNKSLNKDDFTADNVKQYYLKNCLTLQAKNKQYANNMPARNIMPQTDATGGPADSSVATVMSVLNDGTPKAIVGKPEDKEKMKESYRRHRAAYEAYNKASEIKLLEGKIKRLQRRLDDLKGKCVDEAWDSDELIEIERRDRLEQERERERENNNYGRSSYRNNSWYSEADGWKETPQWK